MQQPAGWMGQTWRLTRVVRFTSQSDTAYVRSCTRCVREDAPLESLPIELFLSLKKPVVLMASACPPFFTIINGDSWKWSRLCSVERRLPVSNCPSGFQWLLAAIYSHVGSHQMRWNRAVWKKAPPVPGRVGKRLSLNQGWCGILVATSHGLNISPVCDMPKRKSADAHERCKSAHVTHGRSSISKSITAATLWQMRPSVMTLFVDVIAPRNKTS